MNRIYPPPEPLIGFGGFLRFYWCLGSGRKMLGGSQDVSYAVVAIRTVKGSICRISAFYTGIKALSGRGELRLRSFNKRCPSHFMLSSLQAPAARVISQSCCAAKNAASQARLMPVAAKRRFPLFFTLHLCK